MTEGQPAGHCVRCCWIGIQIGREVGLSETDLASLFYVLLLKDLGCSSNAARICQLYIADDLSFKRDFKKIGDSAPQALRFILGHTGLQSGLADRFRAIMRIVQNGGEIARDLIETRCQRGAQIARRMRFSDEVARGIQDLDEHWDGRGRPLGLRGLNISPFARIALLSQIVDVFHTSAGAEAAQQEIHSRSETWFDPDLVSAFERVSSHPSFWTTLKAGNLESALFLLAPAQHVAMVDEDYLDDIAVAFAQVIDAKSPYTHGHSERVATYTDLIARELGLKGDHRRWLKRAALLHDIGKLGVSNQILDKPGKLDEAEWTAMREHAALSEAILARIGAFRDLARIVGAHHERLDGKGYPNGLAGDQIALETRIISTADVFDALTAERPYRAALPLVTVQAIMAGDVGAALDARCFAALQSAVRRIPTALS
ncbi:HD-GYP domain-containing protein [Microvirga zambiensis]|uniref:HD-GYP domain-containing protein n=1 Tax=Microvirga zambiensis TaxID=1402137 RepID=UPI001FE6BC4D|nr:HD-GYP domain-containing protein [Microvirga zambiensis]